MTRYLLVFRVRLFRFVIAMGFTLLASNMAGGQESQDPRLLWKLDLGDTLYPPAIAANGTLFVTGRNSVGLVAINRSGDVIWRSLPIDARTAPAIGPDGTIFFGSFGAGLYAFSPEGDLKWQFTSGAANAVSIANAADGTVYSELVGSGLFALGPGGAPLWNIDNAPFVFSPPISASEGTIYTLSGGQLYALDSNGSPKWVADIPTFEEEQPAAIGPNGSIYVPTKFSGLYAFTSEGRLLWNTRTQSSFITSPAIDSQNNIYFGTRDSVVAIGAGGSLLWTLSLPGPVSVPAVAANGTLFVGGKDLLAAIGPQGEIIWQFPSPGGATLAPTLGKDGIIYAVSGQTLVAIEGNAGGPAVSAWPMLLHDAQHTGRSQLSIVTSLSALRLGDSISLPLDAISSNPPLVWTLSGGNLPPGLRLEASGVLEGTPTTLGTFTFTIQTSDGVGQTASRIYSVEVVLVLPPASIQIERSGSTAVPGRVLDYILSVSNRSSVFAESVTVTEILDSDLELRGSKPSGLFDDSVMREENMIVWLIPALAPGDTDILTYQARLSPQTPLGSQLSGGPTCLELDYFALARCWFFVYRDLLLPPCNAICFFDCECLQGIRSCLQVGNLSDCFNLFECFSDCRGCIQGCTTSVQDNFRQCLEQSSSECVEAPEDVRGPVDPNEKSALSGKFIQPEKRLTYAVHFENVGDIEARDIFLADSLDRNLDITTVRFEGSTIGQIDRERRLIEWEIFNRDLQPGESDNVIFSVRPRPGLSSGSVIENSATIQFEVFDALQTNGVMNIIDATPPRCVMDELPPVSASEELTLSWQGVDSIGIIDNYKIFFAVNNGAFGILIDGTRATEATFRGETGSTYRFFCVAEDSAGNVEEQAAVAETETRVSSLPGCLEDGMSLCLGGDRFRVTARWRTLEGAVGVGIAEELTDDTGYFWFFDPENVEAVVKVLDACNPFDRFWVFAGGLTNVETELTVTDTLSGESRTYSNPQGTPFQPIQDTNAFATCSEGGDESQQPASPTKAWERFSATVSAVSPGTRYARTEDRPEVAEPAGGRQTTAPLLLNGERFEVLVTWETAAGSSGSGQPVRLTDDTGYFWFFDPDNVEMVIKVLDACNPFGRFWVFAGGLTDVAVEVTVRDRLNDETFTFSNPQRTPFQPVQATSAFATCP